ncbi:unnamed protein product [Allacma fusca]|uniref:Uncharacterized protein n=1 Tax=Allacma fusca TaxID=39272 RepID=A0A8J2L6B0_9HEXA|nr:unnamed protein product [Allacma fusca]
MSSSPCIFYCLILAWMNSILVLLPVYATIFYVIMLLTTPEEFQTKLVEPEDVYQKFLNFSPPVQHTLGISLIVFWMFVLTLSILLLMCMRQRYVVGLKFWFRGNLLLAIICAPLNLVILIRYFTPKDVVVLVLSIAFCALVLFVVGCCVRAMVDGAKQIPESHS